MNARKLWCRIIGHKWRHVLTYGEYREYTCDRCPARKSTIYSIEVYAELRDWYHQRAHAAAAGVAALLDATYAEDDAQGKTWNPPASSAG